MTNTKLIIAIVFASLFGFFTICFVIWCVGCYMHRHCLDPGQYFYTWSLQPVQPPAVVCVERNCSRDEKSVRGRRPERLRIQRDHEHRDCEEGRIRCGNGDTRPMVQHPIQAYHEPRGQPYHPSLKRKDWLQNMQPMMQQQIPTHWQAQGALRASPSVVYPEMPQQLSRQMIPGKSKFDQDLPRYQPQGMSQYRQPCEESVSSEASGACEQKNLSMRGQSSVEHASRTRRVDYVHICDEYPPIVLEALKKVTPASPTASSSSSSNGSGTTQEIPRTSIGCATPDYVTNSPTQFPRYCRFAAGARDSSR